MAKVLVLEPIGGIAGDMFLAAILDLGVPRGELERVLATLPLGGFRLEISSAEAGGLRGTHLRVVAEGPAQPERGLRQILEIVDQSGLSPRAREAARAVFVRIGRAESTVHGVPLESIHFHEIGAVDSLIDIVGFCWGLHRLGIEALFCSPLPLGNGTVATEHGLLPVPAPATLELLAAVGAPTVPSEAHGELLTPTGAALLAACATFARPAMTIERVGYGFGTKEFPWANMLRLWVGQALPTSWVPGAPQAGSQHPPALDQSRAQAHQDPHQHQHEGEHHHSAAQDVHEHDHEHGHAAPETHDHPHEPCAH